MRTYVISVHVSYLCICKLAKSTIAGDEKVTIISPESTYPKKTLVVISASIIFSSLSLWRTTIYYTHFNWSKYISRHQKNHKKYNAKLKLKTRKKPIEITLFVRFVEKQIYFFFIPCFVYFEIKFKFKNKHILFDGRWKLSHLERNAK